jgi:hypothetical protein
MAGWKPQWAEKPRGFNARAWQRRLNFVGHDDSVELRKQYEAAKAKHKAETRDYHIDRFAKQTSQRDFKSAGATRKATILTRREKAALRGGRDALSLLAGGDAATRAKHLTGDLKLTDEQKKKIVKRNREFYRKQLKGVKTHDLHDVELE